LLVETGQTGRFDAVVVVVAEEPRRVRRLVEARGLDEADVRARMRAQVDDDRRRAAATHVVHNDGTMDELLAQVDAVHAHLVAEARERRPVE
jgi:dephospho-CoA kinase